MWWLIPAALSIYGAVQQYKTGQEMKDAAGDQARQAAENREFELQQLAEDTRRQELLDKRLRGSATARAAASGAKISGSVGDYLSFMESEQSTELLWMQKAGKTRANLTYAAGLAQAEQTRLAGKGQMISSFATGASAFSYLGEGGFLGAPKTPKTPAPNNWFA